MKFTDDQMIEIGKVRVRLEAYKNKIQGYPSIPPEPQPAEEPWQPRKWHRLQQLEGRVIHVEKKLVELRAKKGKDTIIEL